MTNVRLLLPNKKHRSSRIFITGRSQSGKTTLCVDLIKKFFANRVDRIFVVCPTFYTQKKFEDIWDLVDPDDAYTERPTDETFDQIRSKIEEDLAEDEDLRFLLFIDDVASDNSTNKGRKGSFAGLSVESPHLGLSIIALFQQTKTCTASLRNNADNFIIFPPGDHDAIDVFNKEQNPYVYDKELSKKFLKAASEVWENNGFVFIHRPARIQPICFERFDRQIVIKD